MEPIKHASGSADHHSGSHVNGILSNLLKTPCEIPATQANKVPNRIVKWLEGKPVEGVLVESMPGHHSVGAALRGDGEGPVLVLSTHNDTVPVVDEDLSISDPCSGQK